MGSTFLEALGKSRLYPLTDRRISGLSHAEQVEALSEFGATLIQLREKSLPAGEFYREAKAALISARERGIKIIINDRVDIALALEADGVHLGQDDLPPEAARALLGAHALIGLSTHTVQQAQLAAANSAVDYIAMGPIFPTSSKEGSSDKPVGLDGLRNVRKAVGNRPVVAIGGITRANSSLVLDAGANAVAMIADLWNLKSQPSREKPTFF